MLVGTNTMKRAATKATLMDSLGTEPLRIEGVEILQVTYEIDAAAREAVLPPALHPTNPPLVTWLFYRCTASPIGAFSLAQTRIECRSGLRPRGFLLSGVIDNQQARRALAARWGYALQVGTVNLRRQYDAVYATVIAGGQTILAVSLLDPEPISGGDLQYVANVNLARTPAGLRLVQVDATYDVERAERGRAQLTAFNAAAWGDVRVRPVYAVSASLALATVTLPRIRFVCRPDVLAFEGTEAVNSPSSAGR